jgi:predicted PurR-regulated permease PerM
MATKRAASGDPSCPPPLPVGRSVLVFLCCLAIVLALWIVIKLQAVVVLAMIAIVLTTGLAPVVVWLEKLRLPGNRRMPRIVAILLVYLVGFVVLSGLFTLVLVPLVQQAIAFWNNLPDYLTDLQNWLGRLHGRYPQVPDYASALSKLQSQLSRAGSYIAGSVSAVFGILGGLVSLFTVLVFTFYLLLTFEDIRKNILDLIAKRHHVKAKKTMTKMSAAMGGWLRGLLLLSLIVGTSTGAVMAALGVPYAYVIGIAGAMGEPIPMVGPAAAAVLGILIAAVSLPTWKLVVVIFFFIILAVVESNVLAPRIMQGQVGLSPLTTILALASGAALLGAVGALLAVPVAAALRVFYYEVVVPAVRNAQNSHEAESEAEQ